jgi:hypothetical protein
MLSFCVIVNPKMLAFENVLDFPMFFSPGIAAAVQGKLRNKESRLVKDCRIAAGVPDFRGNENPSQRDRVILQYNVELREIRR